MDIQVIVNQMIILFLVMIIGYIANKSGILDQTQNQKMSSLVLNITSPGLILSSVRAPTNGSLSSVIQIFLISIAIYMILPIVGILLSRILKVPKEDRNLYQFMTIFSNIGFMGYPVIQSIFGDEALFFASICNLVFNLVCYSYGVYLISGSGKLSFDFKQLNYILDNSSNHILDKISNATDNRRDVGFDRFYNNTSCYDDNRLITS